jgi:hypothetical protein
MTVPELLEARDVVRTRLRMGAGGAIRGFLPGNSAAKDELLTILREIEAELIEQGYTGDDVESPDPK